MSQKLLQNIDKINVNFENGGTDVQRGIMRAMWKILPTSLLLLNNNRSAYFEM